MKKKIIAATLVIALFTGSLYADKNEKGHDKGRKEGHHKHGGGHGHDDGGISININLGKNKKEEGKRSGKDEEAELEVEMGGKHHGRGHDHEGVDIDFRNHPGRGHAYGKFKEKHGREFGQYRAKCAKSKHKDDADFEVNINILDKVEVKIVDVDFKIQTGFDLLNLKFKQGRISKVEYDAFKIRLDNCNKRNKGHEKKKDKQKNQLELEINS